MDLLLLTTLIGAWTPYFFAKPQCKELQDQNQALSRMAEVLIVDDPSMIHVLKLRSNRYGASTWKVFLPQDAQYELRFANEGVSSLGPPQEYETLALAPGEHRVAMLVERFLFKVYVDEKLVIEKEYDKTWHSYSGSSSISKGGSLETFESDSVVTLKREWLHRQLPGFRYKGVLARSELPNKGSMLWLAPSSVEHPPLPTFIRPGMVSEFNGPSWGFLEGIRLRLPPAWARGRVKPGSLRLVHTRALQSQDVDVNQISIKPLLANQDLYSDSSFEGLAFTYSNSLTGPSITDPKQAGVVSEDGRTFTLFLHATFGKGASPIVEVRFESEYPDRVGFRLHQKAGSPQLEQCVFSAHQGHFALLREIHFKEGVEKIQDLDPKWTSDQTADGSSPWMILPPEKFPSDEQEALRQVTLTSDADYSAISQKNPPRDWEYVGIPLAQSWLVPETADFSVAFRTRTFYETKAQPIAGAPVISDCEVRLPFDSSNWIYYQIDPID